MDKSRTRRSGGLGLGMAITRHIVELHGGTIRVESPGEDLGTTFTVRLPVMIVHRRNELSAAETTALLSADSNDLLFDKAKRLNGIHALIVDDEADARELIMFILAEHGASVTTAASVSEAVEKFHAINPDLIISDIEMPDEDGFSLIEKLRDFNEREQKKIPAIALTAHARPSERLKVLSAGYQMHLAKPVEPAELIAVVANFANWNKQK